ncbi:hypothetical protein [Glutamicibacter endophyticus]|uniref:hypothetical protein n=1 Tax=Glutamicibacter endophyticus TaxID=1522174 RepID=UPI003AF1394D
MEDVPEDEYDQLALKVLSVCAKFRESDAVIELSRFWEDEFGDSVDYNQSLELAKLVKVVQDKVHPGPDES